MKVAAYVRPWSTCYYQYFLKTAFPTYEYFFFSDWKGLGQFDWSRRFHRFYSLSPHQLRTAHWLSNSVIFNIIARNFFLRSVSYSEATHLVRCMSCSINELLDYVQPDLIFSPAVDSYVMDLLFRHCVDRSIPYCGMLPSPITGYTRITSLGEQLNFRQPTNLEVQNAINLIANPSFSPVDLIEWMNMYGNRNVPLKRFIREIPKPYLFPLVGFFRGDILNYHYQASAKTTTKVSAKSLFIDRFFDPNGLDRIKSWSGTSIYIPLQAFPECTTDYHVENIDLIDFPNLLPRLVHSLCKDSNLLVCIKEHPGMMGVRPPKFYESFKHHPNVVLLPSTVPASALISECDVVVTWTGTGGLEAAIRGKPVVTIGKPYYSITSCFLNMNSISDIDISPDFIRSSLSISPSHVQKYDIVNHVLSGTFPGEYRFIRFSPTEPDILSDMYALAAATSCHWRSWSSAFASYYGYQSPGCQLPLT